MRPRMLVLAALAALAGCSRYACSQSDCPPEPAVRAVQAVATVPRAGHTIRGTVIDARSLRAVSAPTIVLLPVKRAVQGDSLVAFRIDSLPTGAYSVLVRRIGHGAARVDSVRVDDSTGADVTVPLPLQVMDGCPGFMVMVTKVPWWKWW